MLRQALLLSGVLLAVGCGSPTINVVDPFAVVNWSPHDGASCIDPTWVDLSFSVCLTRPLKAASVASEISLQVLDANGAPSAPVPVTLGLSATDPACAEITGASLNEATDYGLVLTERLEAEDGSVLGHQLMSRFRTRDPDC